MSQNVGMMYSLLKDRHVPKKAKLMIHMTTLRPILLYGHESWILTKKLRSKITAADMKVLRLVKGVTRRDRDEETTAKKVLDLKVKGKQPRGRPRTSWIKYIDNILKERGTTLKEVETRGIHLDRTAWRTFLAH